MVIMEYIYNKRICFFDGSVFVLIYLFCNDLGLK
ncbi:hypothetical protein DEHRE_12340 [Dehalobacter restrictus DSM 9455]|uniref:Uncharacterized protein n=1 Tax=Dehalobacter restrictus (strain DSM 9455 / PER-K23) TaxID=871738 RepID=A0ABM5PAC2_DEHRP|nr:hypothetical protein DEHRE_12340 [Dehalobacter restrictus DSM 9455]